MAKNNVGTGQTAPSTTTGSKMLGGEGKKRTVGNGMSYSATITVKTGVYVQASTSSKKKTTYKKGEKVTVTDIKNDSEGNTWGKTSKGWFMIIKKSTGKEFCKLTTTYKNPDGTKETTNITKNASLYASFRSGLGEDTKEEVKGALYRTMQLFGLPYQFLPSVDYRVPGLNLKIGRKFIDNIINDAPVVTFLPGKPAFLPGTSKDQRQSITTAFLQASSGNLGAIKDLANQTNIDDMKFYDFKTSYIEYMRYVNVMCRAMAAFLELQDNPDEGGIQYCINGEPANFMNFDWKDYRWNGEPYASTTTKVLGAVASAAKSTGSNIWNSILNYGGQFLSMVGSVASGKESVVDVVGDTYSSVKQRLVNKIKGKKDKELNLTDGSAKMSEKEETTVEGILRNVHYVQFYCDPSSSSSESITNETRESQLKSTFNGISDKVKDLAFMTNTGGEGLTKNLEKLGEGAMELLDGLVGGAAGALNSDAGTLISRLTKTGSNVLKGDNVIMPDIYANSKYAKTYQVTIPLRAIYGNKTSIYMDVLVPCAHLLCLALPKATTANTFAAPMLVKVFMPGKFTCNMGIVTGLAIEYDDDSRNVDGLCSSIKVTLDITDLYSDLTMTPASDPILFCNNSSLVEYLAINCGLDILESQYSTKLNLLFNAFKSNWTDTYDNVFSTATEEIDDLIYKLTGL